MTEIIIPDPAPVGDPRELGVNRKNTEQFIKANPTSISLVRPNRTPNGKGGFTDGTPTDIDAQTFRIVPQQRAGIASRNVDGEKVSPVFVMIGRWDADVTSNDTFMLGGRNYSVTYVRGAGQSTAYETWVEVVYGG